MANNFTNPNLTVGITDTDVYVAGAALKSAIMFGTIMANVSANPTSITLKLYDSVALTTKVIGNDLPIPANSTLDFGKIVFKPNDKLIMIAPTANAVNFLGNILEIS